MSSVLPKGCAGAGAIVVVAAASVRVSSLSFSFELGVVAVVSFVDGGVDDSKMLLFCEPKMLCCFFALSVPLDTPPNPNPVVVEGGPVVVSGKNDTVVGFTDANVAKLGLGDAVTSSFSFSEDSFSGRLALSGNRAEPSAATVDPNGIGDSDFRRPENVPPVMPVSSDRFVRCLYEFGEGTSSFSVEAPASGVRAKPSVSFALGSSVGVLTPSFIFCDSDMEPLAPSD